MASSFPGNLPEVFATTSAETAAVSRALRDGTVRKIRRGIYTTNMSEPLDAVVRRSLWQMVALLAPGTVVSHRTALEGKPSPGGVVFVSGEYARSVDVPGLRIRQLKGPAPLPGDAPFIAGLHMSSRPRFLLECLSHKVYGPDSPYLTSREIETQLERLMLLGEDTLNRIRDDARQLTPLLGMQAAFTRLDGMIGTLLGTRSTKLSSKTTLARAAGEPYDPDRLALFQTLIEELNAWPATSRSDAIASGPAFENIGFFDAYFSNFIEGTEFEVDEAIEIAFHNRIPATRPQDAHDVLGTFRIVANPHEMHTKVSELNPQSFERVLKSWHLTIMEGRSDKHPGLFKEAGNRAGQTLFVQPALVHGTLKKGIELTSGIRTAFGRAAFLMFVVSEVHPFDDGNGRVARAIANAELVSSSERRFIVPTVFRTEYIDALRVLSRERHARTFVRMLDQVQEFAAAIDFSEIKSAEAQLRAWNAFDSDAESRLRRPR